MERFVIGEENEQKCVYFPESIEEQAPVRRWIEKDGLGNEYFIVPNFKAPKDHYVFRNYQLKEMFESVIAGNGDIVGGRHPTGAPSIFSKQDVIYFLDRSYGNMMRTQFLKNAERVKFGYLFYFHNNVSMGPGMRYDKNGKAIFMPKEPIQFMYTREEAQVCKQRIS